MSVLLYTAETRTLLAADLRTLQQTLGIRWIDHTITSQSLAILPDWVRRSQPTRLSVHTLTCHLVACLVGTRSIFLVDQTTDGSIRFVTTPATCLRHFGDQPFFVAMAQE